MEMEKKTAEERVKAAKLKILATGQRARAAGYRRQAMHPAYPGQEIICLNKADEMDALAVRTNAEADLIDAN